MKKVQIFTAIADIFPLMIGFRWFPIQANQMQNRKLKNPGLKSLMCDEVGSYVRMKQSYFEGPSRLYQPQLCILPTFRSTTFAITVV